jgi:hypothetical protein
MKRFATALLAGVALFAFSSESFAGANANAKVALHIGSVTTKNNCLRGLVACQNIVTQGGLYPPNLYFTYALVTDGDAAAGISGVQFGVDHNTGGTVSDAVGFDSFGWTLCATLEFQTPGPAWGSTGSGNLITWNGCEVTEPGGAGTGVVAVAGYWYSGAYSPDCLSATPRPVDNAGKVADCSAVEDIITGTPSHFGQVCFGTAGAGYNPCGLITPVENTTWSAIKGSYSK